MAVDFRDVTFVICHLGNPWLTDAMEVIYKNDNVVGDISGFTLKHFEERFERNGSRSSGGTAPGSSTWIFRERRGRRRGAPVWWGGPPRTAEPPE